MKKYRKIVLWSTIIILLVGGVWGYKFYRSKTAKVEYSTYTVTREKLVQNVSATGSVEPSAEFNLNFKTSGKLSKMNVKVGDEVKEGDVLSRLEASDLAIEIKRAEAILNLAKANLDQKLAGESLESIEFYERKTEEARAALKAAEKNLESANNNLKNTGLTTQEEIKNAELSLTAAKDSLANAKKNLENTIAANSQSVSQSYESARTTMKGNLISISTAMMDMDNILGIDNTTANDSFENYLGILNVQTKINADSAYLSAKEAQSKAENAVNKLTSNSSETEIDFAVNVDKDALKIVDDALAKVKTLLDNTVPDASAEFSQTILSSKKTTLNTDRSTINTALSSLETKQQAISSSKLAATTGDDSSQASYQTAQNSYEQAQQSLNQTKVTAESKIDTAQANVNSAQTQLDIQTAALASAQATLNLKKAGPREVDLASLRAQVEEAEASLNLAKSQYGNTSLKAPVDGIITAVNFEEGEQVGLNQPTISMLSTDKFQIEVDISESDITKVSIGNQANITLDAFTEDKVFTGKVVFIEPAATIISGVTYYKIKIQFDDIDEAVKPGMTTNVVITTQEKEGALAIPFGAIEYRENKKFIKVLENGLEQEKEIITGLRGSDGMIEILRGVEENEKVITFTKEGK